MRLLSCHVWSRVMLIQGRNVMFCNYIMFTRCDVTSWCHWWCHLAHASGPIKGLVPCHSGFTLSSSTDGFTPSSSLNGWGGTCACIDWCADIPALLEPTSFKLSWLGCYHFSVSVCPHGCPNTLWELPGNAMFDLTSTISTGPSCLLVGACVHGLLSCQVYISGSMLSLGKTICPALRVSHIHAPHLRGGCVPWWWPQPYVLGVVDGFPEYPDFSRFSRHSRWSCTAPSGSGRFLSGLNVIGHHWTLLGITGCHWI